MSAASGRVQRAPLGTRRDLLRFSAAATAAFAAPRIGLSATEGAKMTSGEIRHRTVETNGIHMHLAEQGEGPLVVLCHGFPESWYSWRHQLSALAAAGFHAVAPDMRGYGQTDRPAEIDQYTLLHLVGDMVGLLDALGAKQAVIAGHDWGAPVAWSAALFRPDRFRGVIGLSVPYLARGRYARPRRCDKQTMRYFISCIIRHRVRPRPNSSAMSA
jgi:pimeloyl-ACP methyl ester carboxylesterase